ncbi:hypothetical protein SKAU_G00373890 [Synaphobranchus kaupii]|uniref:Uncharacterized protein n=1 Tax=Synaphobranchus kaupii TaxID=118154 RepID=A0A9Q1EGK9_SYNKA|nr:hypothetical protein SKAU_G00373890 [Synaphobranchus kaupii]
MGAASASRPALRDALEHSQRRSEHGRFPLPQVRSLKGLAAGSSGVRHSCAPRGEGREGGADSSPLLRPKARGFLLLNQHAAGFRADSLTFANPADASRSLSYTRRSSLATGEEDHRIHTALIPPATL